MTQPPPAATRIEQFRAWLEEYATALEQRDAGALDRLFTVEATYRPTPFAPILRGRRRIREYLERQMAERVSLAITARALGVGTTYAIAHWVSGWTAASADPAAATAATASRDSAAFAAPSAAAVEDGILLAAFDPFGRCTSLRAWHVQADAPPDGSAPGTDRTTGEPAAEG